MFADPQRGMTSVKRKSQVARLFNESSNDAGDILPKNQVETHCGVIMEQIAHK